MTVRHASSLFAIALAALASGVKDRHLSIGFETVASSRDVFAATMRRDIDRWGKVIEDAGIKVQ